MKIHLASLPLEHRADAARLLIGAGGDPLELLHAVIWPEHEASFSGEPTKRQLSKCRPRPEKCIHGHVYDFANTYIDRHGGYICRTCRREQAERYRAKRRAT